jgi:hypothetical protein
MKRQLILSLFVLNVISNYADIAPNPIDLKSIMPSAECKVQMVSETVDASIYKDSSIVECNFNMKNWGESRKIEIGFPVMTFYHWSLNDTYGDDITPFFEVYVGSTRIDKKSIYIPKAAKDLQERVNTSRLYRQKTFQAYRDSLLKIYSPNSADYRDSYNKMVDSFNTYDKTYEDVEPASIHLLLDRKNIPFYVWDVNFKASEELKIKVIYRVPCGMKYKDSARYFYYILSTGAGWFKRIEKATVRVRIMDFEMSMVRETKPLNYQMDKSLKEYVWNFEDLEPTKEDNVYMEYVLPKKDEQKVK